ncbi:MAG: hypothetical protein R3C28_24825 [Pirellulaceae bacterium]
MRLRQERRTRLIIGHEGNDSIYGHATMTFHHRAVAAMTPSMVEANNVRSIWRRRQRHRIQEPRQRLYRRERRTRFDHRPRSNDSIYGHAGDSIWGSSGDDIIHGDEDPTIRSTGEDGNDTILGNLGNDYIEAATDTIRSSATKATIPSTATPAIQFHLGQQRR